LLCQAILREQQSEEEGDTRAIGREKLPEYVVRRLALPQESHKHVHLPEQRVSLAEDVLGKEGCTKHSPSSQR
jgi:hypothetical protein